MTTAERAFCNGHPCYCLADSYMILSLLRSVVQRFQNLIHGADGVFRYLFTCGIGAKDICAGEEVSRVNSRQIAVDDDEVGVLAHGERTGDVRKTQLTCAANADGVQRLRIAEGLRCISGGGFDGNPIKKLATGLNQFIGQLSQFSSEQVGTAVSHMKSVVDGMASLNVESLASARELGNSLKNFGVQGMNALGNSFKANSTQATDGLNSAMTSVYKSVKTQKRLENWKNLGKWLVKGFAQGITDNAEYAKAAARKLADEAYKAAEKNGKAIDMATSVKVAL